MTLRHFNAKKSDAFRVLASSCWRNLRRRQRRHTPWYNPDAPFAQIRVRCGLLNAAVGERRDLIVSPPVDRTPPAINEMWT